MAISRLLKEDGFLLTKESDNGALLLESSTPEGGGGGRSCVAGRGGRLATRYWQGDATLNPQRNG